MKVALLLLGAMLATAGAQENPAKDILGKKAPDFTLPSVTAPIKEAKLRLSSLKGKVVVLDFWAVWCGPCTDSMPFFQKIQDTYRTEGLEVVGLHVNDRIPPTEEVKAFLDDLGVRYNNVVSTTEVDDSYLVYAMPTTYIIDRDGVVQKRHIGFNPKTAPERIERDVKELLSR
jgi:cytochrome c biogenesis protein CcmG, thiol:disulfide interchange protein DsbE